MEQYWRFFTDVWRFFKKHYNPKTEEDWDVIISEVSNLQNKYKGQMFKEIIISVLSEIERLSKKEL